MARLLLAAPLALLPLTLSAQEDSDPDVAFNNHCRTCHSRDEGDNRLGPNLHDIIGRPAGAAEGYQYSSAMAGAGFEWDEDSLDRFIADPDAVVPGHNMKPYSGISEPEIRVAIIAALGGGAAEDGGDGDGAAPAEPAEGGADASGSETDAGSGPAPDDAETAPETESGPGTQ
ncbi:c-type cytochrome [Roseivivax sp. CAU 1761]